MSLENKSSSQGDLCYLDNAATTMCPSIVVDTMVEYLNRGNASADFASAIDSRKMMDSFRGYIASICGCKLGEIPQPKPFPIEEISTGLLPPPLSPTRDIKTKKGAKRTTLSKSIKNSDGGLHVESEYSIIFTSGASESNCHIITSAVRAFAYKTGKLPHIIISAVEHKSVMLCALKLAKEKLTQLTILPVVKCVSTPDKDAILGTVEPDKVRLAIRPNTCLVSIMAANNETGILNDIAMIGAICQQMKIPFHTDAVQMFGKVTFRPADMHVDAFSLTFHKLHGPPGVGALVIRNSLIEGYELSSHICGTQNGGLRGGTENIPGLAASFAGMKYTFTDRLEKVKKISKLRETIRIALSSKFPTYYLDDYYKDSTQSALMRAEKGGPAVIVWISPKNILHILPGILFLSVYRPGVCNRSMRTALESRGIIVSIGSACNSADHNTSSTVNAMDIPPPLQKGILRISLGDDNTTNDIKKFVKSFIAILESDECLV